MSNNRMYKTLSNLDASKLHIGIKRNYYYVIDEIPCKIIEQVFDDSISEKQFHLVDDDYKWNPKTDSLFFDLELSIENITTIFGENGSCYEDATIGIGLVWKPEKSKVKKCIKIGEITAAKEEEKFSIKNIELESLYSNTSFKLILYISKPGSKGGKRYFGNEQGLIIYEEIMWTLVMEGNGSILPIFEIEADDEPLWTFACSVEDIVEDGFDEEHISIIINKKHSLYEFINPKSPLYNFQFLNEVISSALAAIIITIRMSQHDNIFDLEEDCERGSVLQALKYFKEKLNFNVNGAYEDLLKSIKLCFEKKFKK